MITTKMPDVRKYLKKLTSIEVRQLGPYFEQIKSLLSQKLIPQQAQSHFASVSNALVTYVTPQRTASVIQLLCVLATSVCIIYWIMQLLALPLPNKSNQAQLLTSPKSGADAYLLFGGKPIDTGNIKLRGIIHMGESSGSEDGGFAIFDIDGRSTTAIGRGESIGQGFVLSQIDRNSVVISRQGQRATVTLLNEKQKKSTESKR